MWNDINVFEEGIRDFRLDFFDDSDTLISSSSTLTGQISQTSQQEFIFSEVIPNVSRVDLVVINSHQSSLGFNQIEIREVAFTGSSTKVPEPTTILGLVAVGAGLIASKRKKHG